VDRDALNKAKALLLGCEEAVEAIFECAMRTNELLAHPKEIADALYGLNGKLLDAAKVGKEEVPVLLLNLNVQNGGFELKQAATDQGMLGNSPTHMRFFQILEGEGLRPFIKRVSSEEALHGALAERMYIFVRLP